MSQRTIVRLCPAGVGITYIPINRYAQNITIQADAIGAATFAVDYTLDNILMGPVSSYDTQREDFVAPASAFWTNLIASGAVDVSYNGSLSAYALRVNQTVGAGQVRIVISQTAEVR
jgi:hypothetical protein